MSILLIVNKSGSTTNKKILVYFMSCDTHPHKAKVFVVKSRDSFGVEL